MNGIPSFWLTIMKNVEMLSEMVQVRHFSIQLSSELGQVSIFTSGPRHIIGETLFPCTMLEYGQVKTFLPRQLRSLTL